jgi:hypothetical protein
MTSINTELLEIMIKPFQKVLILAPRRSGATRFLWHMIETHPNQSSSFCSLTKFLNKQFESVVANTNVHYFTTQNLSEAKGLAVDCTYLDQLLYMDPRYFADLAMMNDKVIAVSTPGCNFDQEKQSLVNLGFFIVDAPLI